MASAKVKIKSQLSSSFKMHGLTLRSDASKYLVEFLETIQPNQRIQCIDKLLDIIQKQPLSSSLIDRALCANIVQECNAGTENDGENAFCVIDTFSVPRYTYSEERKKFILNSNMALPAPLLHGNPFDKCKLFKDRYYMLLQRTMRHNLFTPPAIGNIKDGEKKFQLKPIEHLLGTSTKMGENIVLGMLTQLKEGKWYLEDPSGSVQIDLSQAISFFDITFFFCVLCPFRIWAIMDLHNFRSFVTPNPCFVSYLYQLISFHTGLFTENCFVLAEGWHDDGIFHVTAFGFPPPEPANVTRSYFGNMNFFGGPLPTSAKASASLRHLESENQDAMFIFLSDVWLDQPKVIHKLKVLFSGYYECPPVAFVFCGNFTSSVHLSKQGKMLKDCFSTLADIISKYPTLVKSCRFIFVPGPHDPGPANILPRPAIPNSITEEFRKKIPNAIFTSNPCRIQYCTQEIVIIREDIVTKLCRNCIHFPASGDVPTHFAKTVICQSHLCPLPLHVCPIYWAYDCGMHLYPLPDLLVVADKYDEFTVTSVDCMIMNPGCFPQSDFSFKAYMPYTRQIENSKID